MANAMLKVSENNAGLLTPEQQKRLEIVSENEASHALEGIKPLCPKDGISYELQQQWIKGKITSKERLGLLKKYYGID